MRPLRIATFLALASAPFLLAGLTSCVAAVAVPAAVLVTQNELDNNTYESRLSAEAETVWLTVKRTLSESSEKVVEADDVAMIAKADIDDSLVTVTVRRFDDETTLLNTQARTLGFNNGEMARLMHERILRRLEPKLGL